MNTMKIKLLAVLGLMFSLPLAAQDTSSPVSLVGDVKAVKLVTDEDGTVRTVLEDPGVIVPGDALVFGTDYANKSADAVTNFKVVNALPAAVRLAPDADPELSVSVDGGKTYDVLAKLTITASDGAVRPATHDDVTHVQWVLDRVAPGETGRLTYTAIIR